MPATPCLSIITDEGRPPERTVDVVERACAAAAHAGSSVMVQLRDRRMPARELQRIAEQLRRVTSRSAARLVVNDRIDVALAVGADGVHLPAAGLAIACAREILGPELLLGRSVHCAAEIAALAGPDLDYFQFGPIFFTPSKAAYGSPQGVDKLAEAAAAAGRIPVLAVGGIDAARAAQLVAASGAGLAGVAVIGAVFDAADPAEAVVRLLASLRGTR